MSYSGSAKDDVQLLRALTPFVRRWKLLMGLPVALAAATVAISLLVPRWYTATTTFTPQETSSNVLSSGGLAGLAGLAGQFGISIAPGGEDSPDFFAKVLTSQELLTNTVQSQFDDPNANVPGPKQTLLTILDAGGDTDRERIGKAIRKFEKLIVVSVDKRSGIVSLEVELRSPELAAAVANRMIELLNAFDLDRLKLQSREQRTFIGERLTQAQAELDQTEGTLLHFLQSNRRYGDSPLLTFQADRLQRKVQLRQDILLTLQREFEQARIAEVRDTPVLTIIDTATPPDKKSSPKILLNLLVATILGALLAMFLAYLSESRAIVKEVDPAQYSAFRDAYRDAVTGVRDLLRLRRGRGGDS